MRNEFQKERVFGIFVVANIVLKRYLVILDFL
jgi:hypothetical protein